MPVNYSKGLQNIQAENLIKNCMKNESVLTKAFSSKEQTSGLVSKFQQIRRDAGIFKNGLGNGFLA